MAISATAAASSLSLSSTSSRRRPIYSSSSSSATSLASSSSLFFTDSTVNRASLGLVVKARTSIKYDDNKSRRKRGLSCNCLFGLGVPELVVIAGVVALVFGPKKLPEVGRGFGKTIKGFQEAAKEFQSELGKEPEAVGEPPTAEKVTAETGEEKQKTLAVAGEEKQDVSVSSLKES